jgi:hypothetical protein
MYFTTWFSKCFAAFLNQGKSVGISSWEC